VFLLEDQSLTQQQCNANVPVFESSCIMHCPNSSAGGQQQGLSSLQANWPALPVQHV
jgi:hypothetical protein